VLATAAVWSGIDREAARTGRYAQLVFVETPATTRQQALAKLASSPALAYRDARAAVLRDPLDRRGFVVLAAALAAGGHGERAERAALQGARLSWREPFLNALLLERALTDGAMGEALLRLDLLLTAGGGGVDPDAALIAFEAVPGGAETLAAHIAARQPDWAGVYWFGTGGEGKELRRRAGLVGGADNSLMGCEAVFGPVSALHSAGLRRDAEALWTAHCGSIPPNPVADPGFAVRDGEAQASPFGWTIHRTGSAFVMAAREGGLRIRTDSGPARLVLSQPVALEAGRYVLHTVPASAARRLLGSLDCSPDPVRAAATALPLLQAPACERQVLRIWARGGERFRLKRLELEPVS
jgi:hypothetical protein